jgi:hypothetical protein
MWAAVPGNTLFTSRKRIRCYRYRCFSTRCKDLQTSWSLKTQVLSFEQIDKLKVNSFDTVMMMGNNFGLFGSFRKAKILLRKLLRIMSPHGLIIAVTTDPYQTKNPTHQRYQRLNRSRGRMPGQLRIRIRHATVIGPWFDYLLVSKREVKQIINGTGWRIKKFIDSKGPSYAMILEKDL